MNRLPRNKNLARIRRAFKRWEFVVTHWGWKFTVVYCDGLDDMPSGTSANTTACTVADWQYLKATIYVNLTACADETDDEIETTVIHEFMHMLIDPLYDNNKRNEMDYIATVLSRTIFGMKKG
jgi:hypothetical protein